MSTSAKRAWAGPPKPKSPFGPGWRYVTVVMRGGTQSQLWRNRFTQELRWHKL